METLTGLLVQHGTETLAARGGRFVGSHRHDQRPTLACQRYPAVSARASRRVDRGSHLGPFSAEVGNACARRLRNLA